MDGANVEGNSDSAKSVESSVDQRPHDKDTDIGVVDLKNIPAMKMWGRPYTKPDGSVLTIMVEPEGQFINVNTDKVTSRYQRDDVLLLGQGDFESGVVKIGRAAFNDPREPIDLWGKPGVLQEEIDKLKASK